MARRRGYTRMSPSSRRKVRWLRSEFALGGSGSSNFGWDLLNYGTYTHKDFAGATVMRTHLRLTIEKNFTTHASHTIVGLFVAPSSLTMTDENDNPANGDRNLTDWLMFDDIRGLPVSVERPAFLEPIGTTGTVVWVKEYDVKAKRKLAELPDTLWFCALDSQATPVSQAYVSAAVLLAMP